MPGVWWQERGVGFVSAAARLLTAIDRDRCAVGRKGMPMVSEGSWGVGYA